MDWQAFIYAPVDQSRPDDRWYSRLERAAHKKFSYDEVMAEIAFGECLDRLRANDWSRLASFEGRNNAKPGTFLLTVFNSELTDFHRRKFGRKTAPTWIKELGRLWETIYKMLCLERLEPQHIIDRFKHDDEVDHVEVELATRQIKGKVTDCGEVVGEVKPGEDDPVFDNQVAENSIVHDNPENILSQNDMGALLAVMQGLLGGGAPEEMHVANDSYASQHGQISAIQSDLALKPRDQLMLRMMFCDNLKVPAIARALDEKEHNVRRGAKRLLAHIASVLEKYGFSADVILGMQAE